VKTLARPPRAETVVIDYLTAALAAHGQDVTCGEGIPATWSPGTKPHVQVGHDGTPIVQYPILWRASVRVTAWATATTVAQDLAGLCEALLLCHPGSTSVGSVQSLTGMFPTRDPDTNAQLATVSVRVNLLGAVVA
jgi:hypothetical protein